MSNPIDERTLTGRSPVEQARLLYNANNADGRFVVHDITGKLSGAWPHLSPQWSLFNDMHIYGFSSGGFKSDFDSIAKEALRSSAEWVHGYVNQFAVCPELAEREAVQETASRRIYADQRVSPVQEKDRAKKRGIARQLLAEAASELEVIRNAYSTHLRSPVLKRKTEAAAPATDPLLSSIVAHHDLTQVQPALGHRLATRDYQMPQRMTTLDQWIQAAECFPSYIAELENRGLDTIKSAAEAVSVTKVDGDALVSVPLTHILREWE